jgi:hypothetical protein
MKKLLFLLLLATTVEAQPLQQVKVDFAWQHNGQFTTGFRLYKGASTATLVKAVDMPGGSTARAYSYTGTDTLPVCFGLSAYGPSGESAVVSKTDTGVDVCLGKPGAPTSFSFSVP